MKTWLVGEKEAWTRATEMDIFLACGDYILSRKESREAEGAGEVSAPPPKDRLQPAIAACWRGDGSAWRKLTRGIEVGSLKTLEGRAAEGAQGDPLQVCLDTLMCCGKLRVDFLLQAGLSDAPPVVVTFFAMLAAHHIVRSRNFPMRNGESLFQVLSPAPSEWASMRQTIIKSAASNTTAIGLDRRSQWAPPPAWYYHLTARGLSALAFWGPDQTIRPGNPWSKMKSEPRSAPSHDDEFGTTMEDSLPSTFVYLDSPKDRLERLVAPGTLADDLAFLAKVIKRGTRPWPVLLFYGPPGTGKTHAAHCLAGSTGRPLATVTQDRLQHKWHGDTEKAYYLAFKEASAAGAVLLLDEADSILYSRSTIHMGWELSKINVLLRLLENPVCPIVLCTNLVPSLDAAIHRRIHYLLEFPAPSAEEREQIWALELKANNLGRFRELDLAAVAAVPLTGGLIHNAVVQAQRRKCIAPRTFCLNTASLLALAEKELPKLHGEHPVRHPLGFSAPAADVPLLAGQAPVRKIAAEHGGRS